VCKAVDNDKETGSKREREKMMELDFEHTHRGFRKIGHFFFYCEKSILFPNNMACRSTVTCAIVLMNPYRCLRNWDNT
jgi:flagellar assembly factor FliW